MYCPCGTQGHLPQKMSESYGHFPYPPPPVSMNTHGVVLLLNWSFWAKISYLNHPYNGGKTPPKAMKDPKPFNTCFTFVNWILGQSKWNWTPE